MPADVVASPKRRVVWQRVYFVALYILASALTLLALLLPTLQSSLAPAPEVGEVALRDYRAPQTTTYISQILTEQRQQSAELAVEPVYSSPDTQIARQRLEDLRNAMAYISSVRADAYATHEQKLSDLAAMEHISLSQETANAILELTDARWQTIQQESLIVLEKVMSTVIRPDEINQARQRVPTLVSLSLPENHAAIVAELVSAFVAANSFYSESLTEEARQQARENVEPVSRTFVAGQTVASRGQVLNAADIEALQKLGLVQPEQSWPELASAGALVLLLGVFMLFFLRRQSITFAHPIRSVTLIVGLFLVYAVGARLLIPSHTVIPYAFPLASFGLLISALFGVELALVCSLPLAVVVAFGLPIDLDLTMYYLMTSLFGVLVLGRAQRISAYLWAGTSIAVAGSLVILVYRLPLPSTDAIGLVTLIGAAFFNGLASSSASLLLQTMLAQFLGMTTPMQLIDLIRPERPLLKRLLRDAPGTYQHSLQVANLAETAAQQIGADALLTRVGALYHDVGKALNPFFFIENQPPGFTNPHKSLDPESSAAMIIRHVEDGLVLAKEHRLPLQVMNFISEHHGTMLTRYQYIEAVNTAGGDESQVDKEKFRYPGPRPQSRETAILMLADGCEARVRAERPEDIETLRGVIKNIIDNRLASGQLDDTDLTLQDLNLLAESFTATLRGIYHPRIEYPRLKDRKYSEPLTRPSAKDSEVEVTADTPQA